MGQKVWINKKNDDLEEIYPKLFGHIKINAYLCTRNSEMVADEAP